MTGTLGRVSEPRYRCTACGNLTRFDITATRRTRAYHHYTVGGDLEVESTDVLSETIESVCCRWCGTDASVVRVDDAVAAESPGESGT